MRSDIDELDAQAGERRANSEALTKIYFEIRRRAIGSLLALNMQAGNHVLIVESIHVQVINRVKAQCDERVMSGYKETAGIDLTGHLLHVDQCCEHRKYPGLSFLAEVATPEMEVDNLCVVE